jgi:hypothetical protein
MRTARPLAAIASIAVSLGSAHVARAQFTTSTNRADLQARGIYSENSLTLPNGSTSIALPPIFIAHLSGATVQNGQISSSTPFDIDFDTYRVAGSFGADFYLAGGGTVTLSFFTEIAAAATTRLVGSVDFTLNGTGPQFFGVLSVPSGFQRVRVSASSGPLIVDNIATSVPEPGPWALLGTGLFAVGGVAVRRRRTTV